MFSFSEEPEPNYGPCNNNNSPIPQTASIVGWGVVAGTTLRNNTIILPTLVPPPQLETRRCHHASCTVNNSVTACHPTTISTSTIDIDDLLQNQMSLLNELLPGGYPIEKPWRGVVSCCSRFLMDLTSTNAWCSFKYSFVFVGGGETGMQGKADSLLPDSSGRPGQAHRRFSGPTPSATM